PYGRKGLRTAPRRETTTFVTPAPQPSGGWRGSIPAGAVAAFRGWVARIRGDRSRSGSARSSPPGHPGQLLDQCLERPLGAEGVRAAGDDELGHRGVRRLPHRWVPFEGRAGRGDREDVVALAGFEDERTRRDEGGDIRSEEHTSELQSRFDL